MTNRYAPKGSALLLFVILTLALTPAHAMLPFTYHYTMGPFTHTYDYIFTIQEVIASVKNYQVP